MMEFITPEEHDKIYIATIVRDHAETKRIGLSGAKGGVWHSYVGTDKDGLIRECQKQIDSYGSGYAGTTHYYILVGELNEKVVATTKYESMPLGV